MEKSIVDIFLSKIITKAALVYDLLNLVKRVDKLKEMYEHQFLRKRLADIG